MVTIRRIGGWLVPYRGRMILAMVLTALACLFNLPVPLLVQGLIDHVVTQGHWDILSMYAALLFGVFVVQAVLANCGSIWLLGRAMQLRGLVKAHQFLKDQDHAIKIECFIIDYP